MVVVIWPIMEIGFMVSLRLASFICFFPHKEILIIAKVIDGQRSATMPNSIADAVFYKDFSKMTICRYSKSIFAYIFWAVIFKLSGYVSGIKKIFILIGIFIYELTVCLGMLTVDEWGVGTLAREQYFVEWSLLVVR